jgi:hypothetical protein
MRCLPRSSFARVLGASILAASSLLSQPCGADDRQSSAAEWLRLGVEDFKRSDYESARMAFGHAYEVEPKAATLLSLALAELQSGHALEAVRHLRAYVKDSGAEPAKVDAVRTKWLPRAEEQTSRVLVEAPGGAEVLVDSRTQGTAPLADPVDVTIGEHDVLARLGPWQASAHVITTGGQVFRAHFEMSEPSTAPSVAPATPSSQPPPAVTEKSTGVRGPSTAKIVTVASMGTAALITVGLGVVFSLGSRNEASVVSNLRAELPSNSACTGSNAGSSQCVALQQAGQTQNQDYWAGNGLYIAGGVLAGTALVTWLLWPNQTRQTAWFVRPMLDARSASVLFDMSF